MKKKKKDKKNMKRNKINIIDENKSNIYEIILDSIADGVFTVDKEWRITSFNKAAEKITGIKKEEAIGEKCWNVFKASICEKDCALRKTSQTGKSIINKPVFIIDIDGNKIPISISTALLKDKDGNIIGGVETFRDLSEIEVLKKELNEKYTFEDIISRNHKMQEIFKVLPQIAKSDSSVLIQGESGTGKELIAKAIHNLSDRRNKPFIAVNCGALPDTLLESELFGYKAGAFTDARKDKPGRLELAEGGTLFLDEIGEISLMMQVKLLRVLQTKEYEPLGSTKTKKANVRIISATNKDLIKSIEKGEFRQDLYYRINVVQINLPPLRERKEDIPLLIEHFLNKFNKIKGKNIKGIENKAKDILMNYDYPGNIRELENIIEHAFILCEEDIIKVSCLPKYLLEERKDLKRYLKKEGKFLDNNLNNLEQLEAKIIEEVLKRNNGNRKIAAKELGIPRSTLFRKIKKYNIKVPSLRKRIK